MIASICSEPKVLEIMRLVNIFISIIRIVVPLLLIFSLLFKFISVIKTGNEDNLAKVKKSVIYNITAAVIIFLIPNIINLIVKISFPNNDYKNCINTNYDVIVKAYNDKEEILVSKAEETLNINDYNNAYNYLLNINEGNTRKSYEYRLSLVKEKIDENNKTNNDKVDYSNFKWTYYKSGEGPLINYSENFDSYAVWGPENVNDLNGVSLPLIIWLHGSGEVSKNHVGEQGFLNSGLLKVMSNWNTYGLKPVPAIIVAPQSYGWWGGYTRNYNTINGLVEYTADYYKIDRSKIVLMGHSMGGNGTIEIAWEMKNLNLYAAVTMSTQVTSYKVGEGGQEFYSKLRMKGYGEFAEHQKFYDWIGQSQNYTYYKGETHGKVPERAFIEDINNNDVSDLVEWLFYND